MKPINLKPMTTAYDAFQKAKSTCEFYARLRNREPELARANTAREQAAAALKDATAKLDALIRETEGRSTARTITSTDILYWCERITSELRITGTAMEGVTAQVDQHAEKLPRAYKYPAMSTQFSLRYHAHHWILTNLTRDYLTDGARVRLTLPELARDAIIDRSSRIY